MTISSIIQERKGRKKENRKDELNWLATDIHAEAQTLDDCRLCKNATVLHDLEREEASSVS